MKEKWKVQFARDAMNKMGFFAHPLEKVHSIDYVAETAYVQAEMHVVNSSSVKNTELNSLSELK